MPEEDYVRLARRGRFLVWTDLVDVEGAASHATSGLFAHAAIRTYIGQGRHTLHMTWCGKRELRRARRAVARRR